MRERLLDVLVDPLNGEPLTLAGARCDGSGEIVDGKLESRSGNSYAIADCIPRFVRTADEGRGAVGRQRDARTVRKGFFFAPPGGDAFLAVISCSKSLRSADSASSA